MTFRVAQLALTALLIAPVGAAAQVTKPSGLPTPDPGLWPERPLSPAEQELRDAIVVMRDTLYAVEATASRLERVLGGSPAVLLATGRSLQAECARGARSAAQMRTYAAGLSTDNARWGDVALNDFRGAVATLEKAMQGCEEQSGKAIAATPMDKPALAGTKTATVAAIRDYERSSRGLLRTLNIPLDPRGSRKPVID